MSSGAGNGEVSAERAELRPDLTRLLVQAALEAAQTLDDAARQRYSHDHKPCLTMARRLGETLRTYRRQREALCDVARSSALDLRSQGAELFTILRLLRATVRVAFQETPFRETILGSVLAEISCAIVLELNGLEECR
jgi:hypothetical protein